MEYCTSLFNRLSPEKKKRILSVAADEFATLGYQSANINIIAKKCDVSVGSLYKYFETKENLFLSVCDLAADALRSALSEVKRLDGGFIDKVRMILTLVQKHSRENPGMIHLYNEFTTQGNRELAGKLSYELEQLTAPVYQAMIEEAQKNGEIDPGLDPKMAAFCLDNLFMSLQFSYATEYYRERMKIYVDEEIFDDDERVLDGALAFIKNAFSAR